MSTPDQEPVLFRAGLLDAPPLPLEPDYQEKLDFTCGTKAVNIDLGGILLRINVDNKDLAEHIEALHSHNDIRAQ